MYEFTSRKKKRWPWRSSPTTRSAGLDTNVARRHRRPRRRSSARSVYERATRSTAARSSAARSATDTLIRIDDGRIIDVARRRALRPSRDACDGVIVPGFIDVHVHGGDGADFMDATRRCRLRASRRFHARHGTTAMAATTLSGSRTRSARRPSTTIARASRPNGGAEICGIHLEGPYISVARAGAQDVASIRPADIQELAALLAEAPHLRWMMTVAPEIEGARALIEHFRDRILFSIGHTAARLRRGVAALTWGASHFTHLFNAMTGAAPSRAGRRRRGADLGRRHRGADRRRHPRSSRRPAHRRAGDAAPHRADHRRHPRLRACRTATTNSTTTTSPSPTAPRASRDGTLAGSVLTMRRAVQNMVELAGLPLEIGAAAGHRSPRANPRRRRSQGKTRAPATTPTSSSSPTDSRSRATYLRGERSMNWETLADYDALSDRAADDPPRRDPPQSAHRPRPADRTHAGQDVRARRRRVLRASTTASATSSRSISTNTSASTRRIPAATTRS